MSKQKQEAEEKQEGKWGMLWYCEEVEYKKITKLLDDAVKYHKEKYGHEPTEIHISRLIEEDVVYKIPIIKSRMILKNNFWLVGIKYNKEEIIDNG